MKNPTRRSFLKTAGMAAALPLTAGLPTESKPKGLKKIFIHQVYFYLNNPGSVADRDKLLAGLKELTKVKTIKQYHIGIPAGTPRKVVDGTYSVSWMVTFKDKAGHDAYQVDPLHQKFIEEYSPMISKVQIYDSIDV